MGHHGRCGKDAISLRRPEYTTVSEDLWDEMEINTFSPPVYVLTNNQMVSGASTVLYRNGQQLKDSLKVVQEQYDVNEFYIIPSSIHKVLLVSALPDMTKEELQSICHTVNETQVAYDEFLSDNIFAYNAIEGFLQITLRNAIYPDEGCLRALFF